MQSMFRLIRDEKYPLNKWLLLSHMTVFVDYLFDLYNVLLLMVKITKKDSFHIVIIQLILF